MAWMTLIYTAGKRRDEEEQRILETLRSEDPQDRNEYKILRSIFVEMKKDRLRALLEEESRAGWEMAAKLDDNRLILRRDRSLRVSDALLPPEIDPYRTSIDSNITMLVVLGTLLALFLTGLVAFAIFSGLDSTIVLLAVSALILLLIVALAVHLISRAN